MQMSREFFAGDWVAAKISLWFLSGGGSQISLVCRWKLLKLTGAYGGACYGGGYADDDP